MSSINIYIYIYTHTIHYTDLSVNQKSVTCKRQQSQFFIYSLPFHSATPCLIKFHFNIGILVSPTTFYKLLVINILQTLLASHSGRDNPRWLRRHFIMPSITPAKQ